MLALATPIFTQIVIDKVIVHHTTSTLIVIAVALFMFMGFFVCMSWCGNIWSCTWETVSMRY